MPVGFCLTCHNCQLVTVNGHTTRLYSYPSYNVEGLHAVPWWSWNFGDIQHWNGNKSISHGTCQEILRHLNALIRLPLRFRHWGFCRLVTRNMNAVESFLSWSFSVRFLSVWRGSDIPPVVSLPEPSDKSRPFPSLQVVKRCGSLEKRSISNILTTLIYVKLAIK